MARGATLRQLLSDLREETRRANAPAAGPDDAGPLRRTINHVYATLLANHDWPHLHAVFPKIPMSAGQRYYDVPTGLDYERITDARVWWNGLAEPLERGIGFDDYNTFDPDQNDRTSPALKWDVRFTGDHEQIEIWPVPDGSAQSVQFVGYWQCPPLVAEDDICRLDSEVVVLYAAAELLPEDSPDKKAKLQLAQELLRLTRLRTSSGAGKTFRLGVDGDGVSRRPTEAVVRVR